MHKQTQTCTYTNTVPSSWGLIEIWASLAKWAPCPQTTFCPNSLINAKNPLGVAGVSVWFLWKQNCTEAQKKQKEGLFRHFDANAGRFSRVSCTGLRGAVGMRLGHWRPGALMRQWHQDIHIVDREEAWLAVDHAFVPVVIDLIGQGDDVALLEAKLALVLRLKVIQCPTAGLVQGGWLWAQKIWVSQVQLHVMTEHSTASAHK